MLKAVRLSQDWSKVEMAARLGAALSAGEAPRSINPSAIYLYERGARLAGGDVLLAALGLAGLTPERLIQHMDKPSLEERVGRLRHKKGIDEPMFGGRK